MKKHLSIITICIALLTISCSDQLERVPVDALVEETAYVTVGDLQRGLSGSLGQYNFNLLVAFNSIFTDNAKLGQDNGGQELNTLNQILTSEIGDRGLWNSRYGVINDFNRLLVAAEGIAPANASEQAAYNNILAQCYAFRAFAHYDLLLYYGFDIKDPSAPGVPYVDYVSVTALPARNTTAEVLEGIQSDLDQALALFPASANDVNFATPDFVTFLRARIALETGDNQGAITFASNLIANYPLANPTQYFNMFNGDTDTTEVIFKYDNVQGFNYNLANIWIFTGTGGGFIEMSNELYSLLDDNDIRKFVNVDQSSDESTNLFIIGKYPPGGDLLYINDFKAMRVSEMYLVRAEAYAKLSQFGPAAADVLAVQTARAVSGTPDAISYNSIPQAVAGIIAERRLELAFEGHRYTDIKRVRTILNEGIERIPSDCEGSVPCSLPASSEKWTFPIPQSEINANPNILPQANGYN